MMPTRRGLFALLPALLAKPLAKQKRKPEMTPEYPVVSNTALLVAAVNSPNFNLQNPSASPSPSWAILQNGLAYFFGLAITGGTITGPDYIINPNGFFFYSGTPAAGNLIAAIGNGNADPFGNLPGPGFYSTDGTTTIDINDGQISFSNNGFISENTDWMVFGGVPLEILTPIASVLNAVEPGTTVTPESWHDLRPLSNSFSFAGTGFWPPQYHMDSVGNVTLLGGVTLPTTYNSQTVQTIPAGWRPAVNVYFPVTIISNAGATPANSASPQLEITTAGVMQFHNLPTGLAGTTVVFSGSYPVGSSPITS